MLPDSLDLVRDVLDTQMIDLGHHKIGKVDGIVLETRDGSPPRIAYLEVGGVVLARRLHPRLGAWLARRGRAASRIEWSRVRSAGLNIEVDARGEETPGGRWERWLRDTIIMRIPGG